MWSENRYKLLNIIYILFFCSVQFSNGTDIFGSYLNVSAKNVIDRIGYKMCIKRCAVFSPLICKSYSFSMYDKACSIYDEDTSTATLVTGTGVWYGERPNIPTELKGPCDNAACSKKERCVVLRGNTFKCVVNECNDPPAISNAIVDPGETAVTTVRTYQCAQGYTLTGTDSVRCKASGNWTTPGFSCSLSSCGEPPIRAFAQVSVGANTYGSIRSYTCNVGYQMGGNLVNNITCQSMWSASDFTCTIKDCGTPPTVANGNPSYTTTTYLSSVTYSCASGYTASGTGQLQCPSTGIWPTLTFTCTVKDCGTPPVLLNGSPSYTSTTYLSTVTYSCNSNYVLSTQSASITCGSNGVWPALGFTCSLQDCGGPPTVSNTNAPSYTSTTVDSVATYTCNTGYTLTNGPGQITCLNGPTWQTPSFSCVIKDCGTPPVLSNGSPSYTSTTYLSTVTYSCNSNYVLSTSSASITCGSNGVWPALGFTCSIQDCGAPSTVSNTNAPSYTSTTINSVATYTCYTGYTLTNGPGQITCLSGPTWQTPTFSCVIKDCGTPPVLSNGSPSYTATTYSSTVTYSCNSNYVLSTSSASITCGSNGVWPALGFTCSLQECPSPPSIHGAIVSGSGLTPGSTRTYSCDYGYVASAGTTTITCATDFTWSSISLTCGTCSPYASTYTQKVNKAFMPPVSFTASISGGSVDAAYCSTACTQRPDFVCVAFYYRKSTGGYCILRDIRVYDQPTYPQYYTDDTAYDEYIRNCG